jgi:hypothetical protein
MGSVTEEKWFTTTDVQPLVRWLAGQWGVSKRKLRLFACACCRLGLNCVTDPRCAEVVAAAERHAQGQARAMRLRNEAAILCRAASSSRVGRVTRAIGKVGLWVASTPMRVTDCADLLRELPQAEGEQAELLREVFGNPFRKVWRVSSDLVARFAARPPLQRPRDFLLAREWFVHEDRAVTRLAEGIYAERSFDGLPILADALEEAGCTEPDILNHCRSAGPHTLGCWVVDLVLAKEQLP